MKKSLKVAIIIDTIITIPLLILLVTTLMYNNYKPEPVSWELSENDLAYFRETYEDSRSLFRNESYELMNSFGNVVISSIPVDGKTDDDLTIDYCYIPASKKTEKLFLLTSGVHGIEGFTGSAIQVMFMKELLSSDMIENMGILLIHGINPYGFKHNRRFTENNVDLNRNSMADTNGYQLPNEGYGELVDWLNPKGEVSVSQASNRFFHIGAVVKILQYSMGSLRQASLQGQYDFKEGIMFGGYSLEPSVQAVTPLIREIAFPYESVFNIELHTGYGTNGTLHLFPKPLEDKARKAQVEELFEGYHIDWGDSDDFYTFEGDFASYVGDILPGKHYLTMTFEFGTLDTLTTLGSIQALHNLILENQGFNYGYQTEEDEAEVTSRILEGYYSSSETWRSKVMADSREILDKALARYLSQNPG